jgi:hypothetical protein
MRPTLDKLLETLTGFLILVSPRKRSPREKKRKKKKKQRSDHNIKR